MTEQSREERQRREEERRVRAEAQRQADLAATALLVAQRDAELASLADADDYTRAKAMRKWMNL